MKADDILAETRQTRDALAQDSGYGVRRLFDYVRARGQEAATRGVKFVSPAPREKEAAYALREEVP